MIVGVRVGLTFTPIDPLDFHPYHEGMVVFDNVFRLVFRWIEVRRENKSKEDLGLLA